MEWMYGDDWSLEYTAALGMVRMSLSSAYHSMEAEERI